MAAQRAKEGTPLERVRAICLGFPGAEEKLSHGANSFFVRGKMFLMFVEDRHADSRVAVWCKSSHDEQERLVGEDPDVFFVPPYVGVKGWVGVRLDRPASDFIGLAILVEEAWLATAPKSLVKAGHAVAAPPAKPPPVRGTTNADVARRALAKVTAICTRLPDAVPDPDAHHATFRIGKKAFAYFLDNHHGDGIVAVCVKHTKKGMPSLIAAEPARFYSPAYLGPKGWLGVRLDGKRVDWDDVALRIAASYRATAPKSLAARVA